MTPERWQQIKRIFHEGLEVESGARPSFLARACGDDADLRREVDGLFAAHEQTAHIVDRPVAQVAASIIEPIDGHSFVDSLIGAYRITAELGRGGMGEVYLANDTRLGRRVAIKVLSARFSPTPEAVKRFQQEARAASALNHPNIVTIHEIGEQDGLQFIVTEYIEGQTLRSLIGDGMPLGQLLDIATQAAGALAAAHQVGIIHRDIKPENVMLRPDGYVKVLDFGLAKLSEPELASQPGEHSWLDTQPGIVMGTVSYMSPEQVRGQAMDARTDIFSLGVLLYEMTAGRKPFAGETSSDVIAAILEREPRPLAEIRGETPAELQRIVKKALAKDRNSRYQSSKDLLIDLRSLRDDIEMAAKLRTSGSQDVGGGTLGATQVPHTAPVGTAVPRVADTDGRDLLTADDLVPRVTGKLSLFERAHVPQKAVAGALGLVLLIAAGYYMLVERERGHVGVGSLAMTITRVVPTGLGGGPAISPDGKYVAYMLNETGTRSIWVRQLATGSAVQVVTPFDMALWGMTFSNDGNYVYYTVEEHPGEGALYQVPTLGGSPRKLLTGIDTPVAFSPDGKRFAFMRKYPGLGEFSLLTADADGTNEQKVIAHKLPEMISAPAWSPNGKTLAYGVKKETSEGSYWQVFELRLAETRETRISAMQWRVMFYLAWLPSGNGLIASAQDEAMPAQLWQIAYPGGEVKRITNDLNYYRGVSLSADASLLASLQVKRPTDIWVLPQGRPEQGRQVTSSGLFEKGVCWLPDGRIACLSIAGGTSDVWVMNADGSGEKQLTSGMESVWLAASADGTYVVFSGRRGATFSLWRVNTDGSGLRQLTTGYDSWPHCAPDGRTIIYLSYRNGYWSLWRVDVEGGEPQQLVDQSMSEVAISPDGKLIAYTYIDDQQKRWRIAVMPAAGGARQTVIEVPQNNDSQLRWAPDGRSLCYIVKEGRAQNIWTQPLEGGPGHALTHFSGEEIFDFDWSRDGKQIVCTRGVYNHDVVLLKNFTER